MLTLTLSDGTRIPVKGFVKALVFKVEAEAIQQKYPKKWKHVKCIKPGNFNFWS